jgi:GT2 family glycosyltransferase
VKTSSVSVIIVSWNHGRLLRGCLDLLLTQQYSPLDITVVDNGSKDGSPTWLAEEYPTVRLWAFPDNRGFSKAFNWGVRHTEGDLVLSLNPDTHVRPGFVREMVQAMCRQEDSGVKTGIVAAKLLRAADPEILDSTGLFIDRRRRPYDRGQDQPDRGQYDSTRGGGYAFGACGAAALYRRTMLEDLALDGEYFDESFFAYCEDADLSWRAQSRGWCCVYAPHAAATHVRGWGDTLRKKGHAAKEASGPRLALRNRYLMTFKNDAVRHVLMDLPLILAAEVPRLAYAALTRPGVLLGLLDLIQALPSARCKRRFIRNQRTVADAEVRRWFVAPAETSSRDRE